MSKPTYTIAQPVQIQTFDADGVERLRAFEAGDFTPKDAADEAAAAHLVEFGFAAVRPAGKTTQKKEA
jgi:hypothetical protein